MTLYYFAHLFPNSKLVKREKAQTKLKQYLLWAQVSDFIYCKGWAFPSIVLSSTNILSYFIALQLFYLVTDISMFCHIA